VATPVGCARSLIVSGETGLLVPARDPATLADALARMLDSPDLRRRCGEAACARVREMSWTATARRTLESYERARASRYVH
jgi:glycosyltransferase involved in cell wall biosynthesis